MTILGKYKFRPGPGGTLVAMAGTALFVTLAIWQFGRADEKRELQSLVESRMAQPSVEYHGEPLDIEAMQYRQLRVQGHFISDGQVLIDNVVLDGKPGYQVITPFRLAKQEGADGGHILVDRGWLPQGTRRDQLPDITVTTQIVDIQGRADRHRSAPVVGGNTPDPEGSNRWLYVDTGYYVQRYGIDVPDFVVRLGPDNPGVYRVSESAYDAKVGMHIGYAIQWSAFAAIAFATWLGLSLKRIGK